MLALQAITPSALAATVEGVTIGEARKLVAAVHRGEKISASSAVRRSAADAVRAAGHIPTIEVRSEVASAIDPFVKYACASAGDEFECVRIPLADPNRFSVCVSSQVGCALACAFCATGRLGLRRNLEAWEIVEQVRVVRARLPPRSPRLPHVRVHGVVFQGMGEPLANLDNVLAAIAVLCDPCALGIDMRSITVCTAGLPVGIRRLAKEAPNVRLGLSVSSAIAEHRKQVMPIADRFSFAEVIDACAEHASTTGLAPMWALTLLAGVNDSDDDAHALVARVRAFIERTAIRPRISLLDYNPIGGEDPFVRSPRMSEFRAVLSAAGLPSHRRYSGGSDVAAACGQLANNV